MGFFDRVKGAIMMKPLEGEDNLIEKYTTPAPIQQNSRFNVRAASKDLPLEQRIEQILASEFSDLQVQREVPPQNVGISAPYPCRPYSYALFRGSRPVAVIMLTPHNRDHNAAFLNAKSSAEMSGVPFLNFYTHFNNERSYVVGRIRERMLKG